ncbi:hypothetical protein ASF61_16955 [Duganella sp. Leaf126]|uniref:helix-turn-helix transcriptional regulator n=1 Tax=Duganella sp. Leaf126 TaxID=1736266 RepID=UPI0006FB1A94|nr:AlpA family phage regulatory protein [Duganella sp. Leaf126]KQQ32023.1 hypothetical protein ASF61_16955 [Duganella sp. Leaf126]
MNMNEMKLFIRMPEVVRVTGKSRSTILRAVKAKTFPAPIHIGPQAIAWDSAEVAKWQMDRIAESRKADE